MNNLLCIDYGRKKTGIAVSEGKFASPLTVLRSDSWDHLGQEITKIVESYNIDKIIVGISENQMAEEEKKFATFLRKTLKLKVVIWDETLSSQDAQFKSKEAGMTRKKRKDMEDAFAATVVLQSYLDKSV